MKRELLQELCALDGISGREDAVRAYILAQLEQSPAPKEITVDPMGNVLVHLIGQQPGTHRLQLDAHMDEVGFLVTHIGTDGFLTFTTVGGVDKQVLYGHRVRIGGQPGVIGGKAIHQCTGEERTSIPDNEAMVIDIGATDGETAAEVVRIGDGGTFQQEWVELSGGRFKSKAVDDRVGCALLLTLAESQPTYDLWLSFSVQEEVGLRGAGVAAEQIRPDIAIALDATTAANIAGSRPDNVVCCVGGGGVVSFADRATLYDRELYKQIRDLAAEHGILTQTKTRIAGGNNAGSIQRSGHGVRMAALSLPCRYIHSPACTGDWADVQAMEDLLRLLIEVLPA